MPILRPSSVIPLRVPRNAEERRIVDDTSEKAPWKKWGTYVSERSWGTVREDYSASGDAWNYLPHDLARSKAYRWGEDGMAGWCDAAQLLCFAPAFWNGADPILKERAFGLNGHEGNHGEDVKEYYFYLENTPTHSYAKYLYKYPQRTFPYDDLVRENAARQGNPASFEYELLDTGIFAENRYFDIFVEYAKASPETVVIRIRAINRGPDAATLHLLPTIWFRDTWSWKESGAVPNCHPSISLSKNAEHGGVLLAKHRDLHPMCLHFPPANEILFTDNATNYGRVYGKPQLHAFCKDAFHEYLIHGRGEAVNPAQTGTKAAPVYVQQIASGAEHAWTFVLSGDDENRATDFSADNVVAQRRTECDAFYNTIHPNRATAEEKRLQTLALSGMFWNKQFYFFDVQQWIDGNDPPTEKPCSVRKSCRRVIRNSHWRALNADFVMLMPDKWEYPWFAAWDLSFHAMTVALADPDLAKEQILLLVSEALLHPNGHLPAYEWEFSDANPPVHAWAAWHIYKSGQRHYGIKDRDFLERVFHKLLVNFTWWVNRKDSNDNNIFEGGFLGLDNISLFDRSVPVPGGGLIEQSDGTAWMGLFSLYMMRIAFELALQDPVYEDLATKFFAHFMVMADAVNHTASDDDPDASLGLWDEQDGFYYDQLRLPDGRTVPLRVRSLVGLLPMVASSILYQEDIDQLPMFKARYEWFINNRPAMARSILTARELGGQRKHLLSIVGQKRFRKILRRLLDTNEFLAPFGLRSLSKIHEKQPYVVEINGQRIQIGYEPAEALSRLKGGNSNWRGPIWFPTTILLLDTLAVFDAFIEDAIKFPFPANNGIAMSSGQIARDIGQRMINLFIRDPATGLIPCYGGVETLQHDPHWRDHLLFFEYFHGDNGAGLGAAHQTGWTGLIANLIERKYR